MVDNTIEFDKDSCKKVIVSHRYLEGIDNITNELGHTKKELFLSPLKINRIPKLIETRVLRKKVPLSNHYLLRDQLKLISFFFDTFSINGRSCTFQFASAANGYFEDFDEPNSLHIDAKKGTVMLYFRAIDKHSNTCSKLLPIKVEKINSKAEDFSYIPIWWWFVWGLFLFLPIFHFRFRKKMHQQKAKIKEQLLLSEQRNAMISNLHDDIGASLSSLQLNSTIANQLIKTDIEKAASILSKIAYQSKSISENLNDFIWGNKTDANELMALSVKIKTFTNDILGNLDINFQIEIDSKADHIKNVELRKSIVMMMKEAINNAAKYSKAADIQIYLRIVKKNIEICIIDNGIGFDASTIRGNGLENMRKRTILLKGTFEIQSSKNKGTSIKISLPYIVN